MFTFDSNFQLDGGIFKGGGVTIGHELVAVIERGRVFSEFACPHTSCHVRDSFTQENQREQRHQTYLKQLNSTSIPPDRPCWGSPNSTSYGKLTHLTHVLRIASQGVAGEHGNGYAGALYWYYQIALAGINRILSSLPLTHEVTGKAVNCLSRLITLKASATAGNVGSLSRIQHPTLPWQSIAWHLDLFMPQVLLHKRIPFRMRHQ